MFPGFLASRRRKWAKNGGKWVKNEITGLQKTVLMHASAHLDRPRQCPLRGPDALPLRRHGVREWGISQSSLEE